MVIESRIQVLWLLEKTMVKWATNSTSERFFFISEAQHGLSYLGKDHKDEFLRLKYLPIKIWKENFIIRSANFLMARPRNITDSLSAKPDFSLSVGTSVTFKTTLLSKSLLDEATAQAYLRGENLESKETDWYPQVRLIESVALPNRKIFLAIIIELSSLLWENSQNKATKALSTCLLIMLLRKIW